MGGGTGGEMKTVERPGAEIESQDPITTHFCDPAKKKPRKGDVEAKGGGGEVSRAGRKEEN